MVQLDSDAGALSVTGFREVKQARDVAVLVDAELGGSVGPFRIFYADIFHKDQSGAASCSQFIILDVLVT